jgi:ketosteroid isomerase-like protein
MADHDFEGLAREWVRAWNERDLDAIVSHYSEDVEFHSPLAVKLLPETRGTIRGRQDLRQYFLKGLAAFPGDLEIELLGVYRGVDSLVVHFQSKGRIGAEVMELDQDGKVRRAMAHVRV